MSASKSDSKPLEVTIAGETFRLNADPSIHDALRATAGEVDKRITEINDSRGSITLQRAAIMAAFHFAYESEEVRGASNITDRDYKKVSKKLESIIARIDENLKD